MHLKARFPSIRECDATGKKPKQFFSAIFKTSYRGNGDVHLQIYILLLRYFIKLYIFVNPYSNYVSLSIYIN